MTAEPMHSNLDLAKIEEALEQVRTALDAAMHEETRAALLASLQILETLAGARRPDRSSRYDGSIEYTFEDEDYKPFGRKVDVRIYYRWCDYNPADDPRPVWGATIEDLEVLAIRYFDEVGNEVHAAEHPADVAWHLLQKSYQQVTEACTEDGYRRGAGYAPLTYAPGGLRVDDASSAQSERANFGLRMAPSIPTRPAQLNRRQLG